MIVPFHFTKKLCALTFHIPIILKSFHLSPADYCDAIFALFGVQLQFALLKTSFRSAVNEFLWRSRILKADWVRSSGLFHKATCMTDALTTVRIFIFTAKMLVPFFVYWANKKRKASKVIVKISLLNGIFATMICLYFYTIITCLLHELKWIPKI